jgi:F-type H+-transporting ATPase subunit gamma
MDFLLLIKNRIDSIVSTRQITQSMRTVATVKVRRAREKLLANRPFLEQARRLVQAAGAALPYGEHPLLSKRGGKRAAVVAISGDRGLCGGYNVNAGKALSALAKGMDDVRLVTVGAKIGEYCAGPFRGKVAHSYTGISENPFYGDAEAIASIVMDWYKSGEVDQVYVVYTQFNTMLSQKTRAAKLLPLEIEPAQIKTRFEIPPHEIFTHAVPFYVTAFIYGAILESAVCEQSARIATMDAAVRNAGGMIDALTLLYHQARQGEITREIIEIVSGADASGI